MQKLCIRKSTHSKFFYSRSSSLIQPKVLNEVMGDSEDLLIHKAPTVIEDKKKTRKKSKRRPFKKKMKPKVIPNHFLAFKIHDPVIRDNVARFQKRVIEKNPLLNKALIDLRTLHVTLAVTHLGSEERIRELQKKLMDWSENNLKTYFKEPIHLTFKGVGTFGQGVMFVKVNECENYNRLCLLSSALNDLLSDSGFYRECRKTFTPHLTLLKLSKNSMLFKDSMKEVSSDIRTLSNCDDDFGSQDVGEIQLLSMADHNEDDGYYKCLWEAKTNQELVSGVREEPESDVGGELESGVREELESDVRELESGVREELESEASQPNRAVDTKGERSTLRYALYTVAGICPLIVILSLVLNKR